MMMRLLQVNKGVPESLLAYPLKVHADFVCDDLLETQASNSKHTANLCVIGPRLFNHLMTLGGGGGNVYLPP